MSRKKVMLFALAGILALILGIATGRMLETLADRTQAEHVD